MKTQKPMSLNQIGRQAKNALMVWFCLDLISCQTIHKAQNQQQMFNLVLQLASRDDLKSGDKSDIEYHGFQLSRHSENSGHDFWQLKPYADDRLGKYWLRSDQNGRSIHLQAPHRFSDLYTGEIAELFCQEHHIQTCSFNLVHRRDFDFTQEPRSAFQDFVEAIIDQDPRALIVQIHGFAQEHRVGSREQEADFILSGGSREAGIQIKAIAENSPLSQAFKILVFGSSTYELGATANVQNRLIQASGKGMFLHLELSYQMRRVLLIDEHVRRLVYELIISIYDDWTAITQHGSL